MTTAINLQKKYYIKILHIVGSVVIIAVIVMAALFGLTLVAHAGLAEIEPIADSDIRTTKVTLHYKNIAAAKKFKFELWSKGITRNKYNKDKTFYKKRINRKTSWLTLKRKELTSNRDYKIRYRAVYSGGRLGGWSDFAQFRTKNPEVTFTLTVDDSFQANDTPYVIVDSSSDIAAGSYAMTETEDNVWSITIDDAQQGDTVRYVYSRNDLGSASYELFEPDDPSQLREFTLDETPYERTNEVTDWRWLDNPEPTGDISEDNYAIADRDQFIMSIGTFDYYWPQFDPLVESTMQRIANQGFEYVTIYHAPRTITNGDPIETTQSSINTQTTDELATEIQAAQAAELKIILNVMLNPDPGIQDEIEEQMDGTHADSYFETYLTRWREAMRDGVEIAIANDIEVVVLRNPWHHLDYVDDEQKTMVNSNIKSLLATITSDYDGIVTTEYYETDDQLDFYNSEYIDWVGTKWFPTDLSDSYDPTIDDMYTDAVSDMSAFGEIYDRFGKPIFLNQLAIHSWDGAAGPESDSTNSEAEAYHEDYADDPTNPIDYQEQADAYEAVFRAIADSDYIIGAASFSYTYHTQYDKSANIRSKLAEQVWTRWNELFAD